jgi:hypothetical protein
VIVTNKEKPYVLGTRLRVNHNKIAEIEILWTTTGYWLFNADTYLQYSSTEKWDTIPIDKRDTRDTLVAAANAYLDAFLEGKVDLVPWGYPCNRTEGGAHIETIRRRAFDQGMVFAFPESKSWTRRATSSAHAASASSSTSSSRLSMREPAIAALASGGSLSAASRILETSLFMARSYQTRFANEVIR